MPDAMSHGVGLQDLAMHRITDPHNGAGLTTVVWDNVNLVRHRLAHMLKEVDWPLGCGLKKVRFQAQAATMTSLCATSKICDIVAIGALFMSLGNDNNPSRDDIQLIWPC
jgi:hypothetical protein